MDKKTAGKLSKEFIAMVREFEKKHGLDKGQVGSFRYDELGASVTVNFKDKVSDDVKAKDFDNKAVLMDIPTGLYNKQVEHKGVKYTIIDINTRAYKRPLVMLREDGTQVRGERGFAKLAK